MITTRIGKILSGKTVPPEYTKKRGAMHPAIAALCRRINPAVAALITFVHCSPEI
jgi:hypothetical protein